MSISDKVNKFLYGTDDNKVVSSKDKLVKNTQFITNESAEAVNFLIDWLDEWHATEIEVDELLALEIPDYEREYMEKWKVLRTRLYNKLDSTNGTEEYLNDWVLTVRACLISMYESVYLRGFVINDDIDAQYPAISRAIVIYNLGPDTAISEAHNTIDSLLDKYPY